MNVWTKETAGEAPENEFILVDKAKVGSDILHRVNRAKQRGSIQMSSEVYKWFAETSDLSLADPRLAKKRGINRRGRGTAGGNEQQAREARFRLSVAGSRQAGCS